MRVSSLITPKGGVFLPFKVFSCFLLLKKLKYNIKHDNASAKVSPKITAEHAAPMPLEMNFFDKYTITPIRTACSKICEKAFGETLREAIK